MTNPLSQLSRRRRALVARSTRHRADLAHHVSNLRGGIALLDSGLRLARGVFRSGPAMGAVVGLLLLVGPRRVGRIASRAARFAPYALEAFAMARRLRASPSRPT